MKSNPIYFYKSIQSYYSEFIRSGFHAGIDDRRLLIASIPVFLLTSLLFSHLMMARESAVRFDHLAALDESVIKDKVYPVLVEQKDDEEIQTERIRALSEKDVEGHGGLTEKEGFHTISSYDTISAGQPGAAVPDPGNPEQSTTAEQDNNEKSRNGATDSDSSKESNKLKQASAQNIRSGNEGHMNEPEFKIPANYRFREDFRFRFDERGGVAVPAREMAGFKYFRDMLRRIRETFAPPGLNYAYRDFAGTVVSQPIKPQVVKVLFSIDYGGEVRDVRVVSSMGQDAVDKACVDVLEGKNFGTPPPEIFSNGHIFGINFIFPSVNPGR